MIGVTIIPERVEPVTAGALVSALREQGLRAVLSALDGTEVPPSEPFTMHSTWRVEADGTLTGITLGGYPPPEPDHADALVDECAGNLTAAHKARLRGAMSRAPAAYGVESPMTRPTDDAKLLPVVALVLATMTDGWIVVEDSSPVPVGTYQPDEFRRASRPD